MYSKYWICWHADGVEGYENAHRVDYETVKAFFEAEGLEVEELYPVTADELYSSEVDIW